MSKIQIDSEDTSHSSSATHSVLQHSSTLSRKYVKKPTPKIKKKTNTAVSDVINNMNKSTEDRKIKSALQTVDKLTDMPKMRPKHKPHRILLAIACSAATVAAIAAFVYVNMPDISVKVAAMQSGIEATYPTYTPRNFTLSGVTSEKSGKVTLSFNNNSSGDAFSLSEESSTWDSNALLNNYVKDTYDDYATLREQGITIYIDKNHATWVNGGIHFEITNNSGHFLTKEQIRNLVVSL